MHIVFIDSMQPWYAARRWQQVQSVQERRPWIRKYNVADVGQRRTSLVMVKVFAALRDCVFRVRYVRIKWSFFLTQFIRQDQSRPVHAELTRAGYCGIVQRDATTGWRKIHSRRSVSPDLRTRVDLLLLYGWWWCDSVLFSINRRCLFTIILIPHQTHCETLWCGNETDGCLTLLMPWADGTSCTGNSSDEHWCQRGKCVHRNPSAMVKVDGGWGPWSRYTKCSRTCGGGITSTKRECNHPTPKNGGKYCVGQRIRYESCNVENCPPDEVDFREQQCSSKDGNTFDVQGISTNVKYVPKYASN